MSMFEGFKNMLGINQDPEDDEYLDGGEDEVFAGGNQGQTAPDAYAQTEETRQRQQGGQHQRHHPAAGGPGQAGTL